MPDRNYLLASEVGRLLKVSPKTVTRWASEGRIPHMRTLGGHRRYDPRVIDELVGSLVSQTGEAEDVPAVSSVRKGKAH